MQFEFLTLALPSDPGKHNAEIVARVRAGLDPPFRPQINEEEVPPELLEMVSACWDENAALRPTFAAIRSTFRRSNL